ncbi:UNVERIFIED_ORG: 1,2-phenylacetyl-CoA epoxidase PaaB subunit [Peribacillus simplex]
MNNKAVKQFEYNVFSRINRGDDLMHIGTVEANSDELARVYARYIYDEEKWVEMYIVKRENMICIREVEPFFKKRVV